MAEKLKRHVSRTTLRKLLKQAGLSWKKCWPKPILSNEPTLWPNFSSGLSKFIRASFVYLDEAHIHQDMALGYRWSGVGEADWVPSHCLPLKNRLNWYGAYDFTNGQCLIWHQENCNAETTVAFLLAQQWPHLPYQQTAIIWDGASWHSRAEIVRDAAEALDFILIQLPAYSPDLNPIEGLWKWMREELTQHHSYKYLYQLERACFDFIDRINLDPVAIITRLWPKFDLDPEYEKVMFSP